MTDHTHTTPPIVLTTDFGLSDAFVGVMKGVILSINPSATIVDLTHDIGPQDLRQGAFVLGVNHSYFPSGTIHVSVVDPGVGTNRRPIVLETPEATFVAPDNGLLSEVVKGYLEGAAPAGDVPDSISIPPPLRAFELANSHYRLHPVSNTFHGRDIFAPAAAHLSLGVRAEEMGPPVTSLVFRPLPEATLQGRAVSGEVIYVDRFGNLISNISATHLGTQYTETFSARVEIGGQQIRGLSRTFHETAGESPNKQEGLPLVALVGSNGYLEIAVRDGSAAESLRLGVGAKVRISFGD